MKAVTCKDCKFYSKRPGGDHYCLMRRKSIVLAKQSPCEYYLAKGMLGGMFARLVKEEKDNYK